MKKASLANEPILNWVLRIGAFGIYVGHGMFGVLGGKASWLPYFHVVGIPDDLAWPLMVLIGLLDVTVGILALVLPMRIFTYYMVFWGFWTALLRPLAGEGWWEFLERFPNWIVPLAFLYVHFKRPFFQFTKELTLERARSIVMWCLRIGTGVHFIGHGGYGAIMAKPLWYKYFGAFGFDHAFVDAANLIRGFGWFEILLGIAILFKPARVLLLLAILLMAFDPGARLLVHEPIWEFVERFGNIAAPLALLAFMGIPRRLSGWFSTRMGSR